MQEQHIAGWDGGQGHPVNIVLEETQSDVAQGVIPSQRVCVKGRLDDDPLDWGIPSWV